MTAPNIVRKCPEIASIMVHKFARAAAYLQYIIIDDITDVIIALMRDLCNGEILAAYDIYVLEKLEEVRTNFNTITVKNLSAENMNKLHKRIYPEIQPAFLISYPDTIKNLYVGQYSDNDFVSFIYGFAFALRPQIIIARNGKSRPIFDAAWSS